MFCRPIISEVNPFNEYINWEYKESSYQIIKFKF